MNYTKLTALPLVAVLLALPSLGEASSKAARAAKAAAESSAAAASSASEASAAAGQAGALGIFLIIILFIVALLYFLPTFVAFGRKHPSKWSIFLVNFFLGATFVGWIVSLVWAFGSVNKAQNIVVNVNSNNKGQVEKLTAEEASRQIDALVTLKDQGHITQEEFNKKKSDILAKVV